MASPAVPRSRTIVVYGRPGIPRNAFPAIVDGLRAWRAGDPNAAEWNVISVGEAHPEIDLGGGAMLRSSGKLDLDAYARLLRGSAIGVSLMVSPHPSYPPLEMAHLGMLVLTNGFGAKDLSSWHDNIRSVTDISARVARGRAVRAVSTVRGGPGGRGAGPLGAPRLHLGRAPVPVRGRGGRAPQAGSGAGGSGRGTRRPTPTDLVDRRDQDLRPRVEGVPGEDRRPAALSPPSALVRVGQVAIDRRGQVGRATRR